jgi:transposase
MDTIPMQSGTTSEAPEGSNQPPPYVQYKNRRGYRLWFKLQLVRETFVPGASVSIVARRHKIKSNLPFTWRR